MVLRRTLGTIFAAAGVALAMSPATAGFQVRSPNLIDYLQVELENNGFLTFDGDADENHAAAYTIEVGYGVTTWWHPTLEFEFEREAGQGEDTKLVAATWENIFRLSEPGENWVDTGLFLEYAHAAQSHEPDEAELGILFQKNINRTSHTLNVYLAHEIGSGSGHEFEISYAWQSRWNLSLPFSPAVEIYGAPGTLGRFEPLRDQQLIAGPVATGTFLLGDGSKIKYEAGYLFGLTPASPDGTLRWKIEYEQLIY